MTALLAFGLRNALLAAVLAVPVAALARISRRPALAHGLWLLVLLRLVMPPLWTVQIPGAAAEVPSGHATTVTELPDAELPWGFDLEEWFDPSPVEVEPTTTAADATVLDVFVRIWLWVNGPGGTVLVWIWLGGAVIWFGRLTFTVRRFQRLLRYAKPATTAADREIHNLARRLGLRRAPGLWLVPGVVSPMLWAVGRARLLFPIDLLAQLDAEQRTTLFAHELAHYRRRDHWVRWLEVVVVGLYWWHPVAWWARRELREAEEQCCDAWVTALVAAADRTYATALVQTVRFLSHVRAPLPATASGLGHVRHLQRRLTMIMRGTTPRSLSWAGLLAVLAVGLFWLPLAPSQARTTADDPEEQQAGKSSDELDRKIAEVQKALKALEEQKRREAAEARRRADDERRKADEERRKVDAERRSAERSKADPESRSADKVSDADRDAIKTEFRASVEQVEMKRRELRQAEERLRGIAEKMARIEGVEPEEIFKRLGGTTTRTGPSVRTARTATAPAVPPPAALPRSPTPASRPVPATPSPRPPMTEVPATGVRARTAPANADERMERLMQRMEQLAKEIDDLRREVKRRPGQEGLRP